ncbi:lysophospholipid acyltransferase family protein [Cryptosporangium minutisporangium]|uniref:Lysophospholipid acyltransferase family protein n=1 Tax=Cryptosporangium minutisporangium TaxID=113569 RepID=A0ABP6SY31_9ACTN
MAEFVYPPVIALARGAFAAIRVKVDEVGGENIPRTGGAVLASNHVSYLDFLFCGLAAQPSKRLVRFMAKQSVFDHKVSGPLMRGMKHIPVDRAAGAGAYGTAVKSLAGGEIVGVFPEATVSRSFLLKDFKLGAARMAAEAGVPLVPMIVWGTQRYWAKENPRQLTRRNNPVLLRVGEPLNPTTADDPAEVTAEMKRRMTILLDEAIEADPYRSTGPDDLWWLPASRGGTAPTPEDAAIIEKAEVEERIAQARAKARVAAEARVRARAKAKAKKKPKADA